MSDPKKPEEDIISTDTAEPETVSDDALQDVDGGWSWGTYPTKTFKAPTGIDAETITATKSIDTLGKTLSGDIGKIGALRKRPTR